MPRSPKAAEAFQKRVAFLRGRGMAPTQARELAFRLEAVRRLKRNPVINSKEAYGLARDQALLRSLRANVVRALKKNGEAVPSFGIVKQRFVLSLFSDVLLGRSNFLESIDNFDGGQRYREFFQRFSAAYAHIRPEHRDRLDVLERLVLDQVDPSQEPFVHAPREHELETRNAGPLKDALAKASAPARGIRQLTRPDLGGRLTENAVLRAVREGTVQQPEVRRALLRVFIGEQLNPNEVLRTYNLDRTRIAKGMDAFLREQYRNFDARPEAAKNRIRREFEMKLVTSAAKNALRERAEMFWQRDLKTLAEQAEDRAARTARAEERDDWPTVRRLQVSQKSVREAETAAGLIKDLFANPRLDRFIRREIQLYFKNPIYRS